MRLINPSKIYSTCEHVADTALFSFVSVGNKRSSDSYRVSSTKGFRIEITALLVIGFSR
jgi:hypothetical protein